MINMITTTLYKIIKNWLFLAVLLLLIFININSNRVTFRIKNLIFETCAATCIGTVKIKRITVPLLFNINQLVKAASLVCNIFIYVSRMNE